MEMEEEIDVDNYDFNKPNNIDDYIYDVDESVVDSIEGLY